MGKLNLSRERMYKQNHVKTKFFNVRAVEELQGAIKKSSRFKYKKNEKSLTFISSKRFGAGFRTALIPFNR